MKKLLVADSYDSFTYNLIQLIEQHGGYAYTVVKTDQIHLEEVQHFDKILLTPGPGLPSESGALIELIQYYASSKSILGVCLGHQAIAEAFGARLIQLPQVLHGLTQHMTLTPAGTQTTLFANLPSTLDIGLYHSWVVQPESLPADFTITGVLPSIRSALPHFDQIETTHLPLIMALAHRSFDIQGIQFHPESIMTEFGREILYNWLNN
ncbi:aminodeoxychorismate/anthranilate synthase component II [marine bacterium AO1-C]|nr:aminodeoxychorismate/anthranilate synthase component II [marine bacterium AO1-C]